MNWSEPEVQAAVAAYFKLLNDQEEGRPSNKSAIYRELGTKFNRSPKAFERKFMNISAILYELHLPYCDGLKPLHGYQRLLKLYVLDHLDRSPLPTLLPHDILFDKLRRLGFIKVSGKGTGRYGLAVEQALGVKQNSSKDADFMGIELKTKYGKTLQTLFAKAPSHYPQDTTKAAFFDRHAYLDHKRQRRALYTSFSSSADTLGFSLRTIGHTIQVMHQGNAVIEYDAEELETALLTKHSQSVFISVQPSPTENGERVKVAAANYCKWPSILRFLRLIDQGAVNLDFTMSENNGKVKDHGFLWRIRPDALETLYLQSSAIKLI